MADARKPLRTCIGCGKELPKNELLRYVLAPDGVIVPDVKGKLHGRGTYTCPERACLEAAVRKKQFNRSFRIEVSNVSVAEVAEQVQAQARERLAGYLALATKAGKIVSGTDMVAEAMRKGRVPGILFVADDISETIEEKVLFLARREGVEIVTLFDKDRLGQLVGKGLRSVIAVEPGGFADAILSEYHKFRNFFDGGLH